MTAAEAIINFAQKYSDPFIDTIVYKLIPWLEEHIGNENCGWRFEVDIIGSFINWFHVSIDDPEQALACSLTFADLFTR